MMCVAWIIAAALGGLIVGVVGLYLTIMYQCHILEGGKDDG